MSFEKMMSLFFFCCCFFTFTLIMLNSIHKRVAEPWASVQPVADTSLQLSVHVHYISCASLPPSSLFGELLEIKPHPTPQKEVVLFRRDSQARSTRCIVLFVYSSSTPSWLM